MITFLKIAALLALLAFPSIASAATCFWVGGTGTWSTSNTASWASSTGGTAGTCAATGGIPKQSADVATFDGSSGGGTVTVDSTINGVTLTQITMGAFTGTLDFSVNNPSVTLGVFSISGSGTRTLKLGSGTFTINGSNGTVWDITTVTGLTFNVGTATIAFSGTPANTRTIQLGTGLSYSTGTITIGGSGTSNFQVTLQPAGVTVGTLNLVAPLYLNVTGNLTVTNAVSTGGTAYNSSLVISATGTKPTWTFSGGGNLTWCAISNILFSGSPTATNSFDLGGNSGITITGPSGGGGGHIIGG